VAPPTAVGHSTGFGKVFAQNDDGPQFARDEELRPALFYHSFSQRFSLPTG